MYFMLFLCRFHLIIKRLLRTFIDNIVHIYLLFDLNTFINQNFINYCMIACF